MKKEIKFLYTKKHKLKNQLHYTHIELANICGYVWQHIKNYIHEENFNTYLSAFYSLVISHPNIKCYIARDSETAVQ
jgi:pyrroloquinoline quinone (PQQ) biosynthesis protein C